MDIRHARQAPNYSTVNRCLLFLLVVFLHQISTEIVTVLNIFIARNPVGFIVFRKCCYIRPEIEICGPYETVCFLSFLDFLFYI